MMLVSPVRAGRAARRCSGWLRTASSEAPVFDRALKRRQRDVAALAPDSHEYHYLRDEVAPRWFGCRCLSLWVVVGERSARRRRPRNEH